MLPCNVAAFAIAAIFYAWRDVYVPRRARNQVVEERVSRLLWVAASQTDSDLHPPTVIGNLAEEEPEDWDEEPEPAFTLFRNVDCRACGGTHTFHCVGSGRPGSTYEFTCPSIDKAAWIWWLDASEPVEVPPAGSVNLKWIPG
jgi:hypothetical protein